MNRKRDDLAGKLQCRSCEQWLHTSRFRTKQAGHGTVSRFAPDCRTCEQTRRTNLKNADRGRALIEYRASAQATKAGVSRQFVMSDLNFVALIPSMNAALAGAPCANCGHPFLNERDIQLEHRLAPRHRQDWARLHARNIALACGSCNSTKGRKDYGLWLDEQEAARLSAASSRISESVEPTGLVLVQMDLWA